MTCLECNASAGDSRNRVTAITEWPIAGKASEPPIAATRHTGIWVFADPEVLTRSPHELEEAGHANSFRSEHAGPRSRGRRSGSERPGAGRCGFARPPIDKALERKLLRGTCRTLVCGLAAPCIR